MHESCLSVRYALINMLSSQERYGFSTRVYPIPALSSMCESAASSFPWNVRQVSPWDCTKPWHPTLPLGSTIHPALPPWHLTLRLCFSLSQLSTDSNFCWLYIPGYGATHWGMAGPTRSHTIKKSHQLSIAPQGWGLMIPFPLHARMLTVNWCDLVWYFLFLSAFHVDMSKYTLLWFICQVHQAPCWARLWQ